MKGDEDSIYFVAILFTFIIGLSALYVFYIELGNSKTPESEADMIKDYIGIPDEIIEKISTSRQLQASLEFGGFLEGTNGIIIRNAGDVPLSGFGFFTDGQEVSTFISPDVLFPGSYGIILLDDTAWNSISDKKFTQISTRQGVRLFIRK